MLRATLLLALVALHVERALAPVARANSAVAPCPGRAPFQSGPRGTRASVHASSALENARIARVCCLCYVIADVICASPNGALSQYREDQGPACRQGRTALCVWQCFPSTCIWPCGLLELISVLLLLGLARKHRRTRMLRISKSRGHARCSMRTCLHTDRECVCVHACAVGSKKS